MSGQPTQAERLEPEAEPRPDWLDLPRGYNAACQFIDRHLAEGRADKTAYYDDRGSYTYGELVERVNRAGNVLRHLGVEMEQRVALCLPDSIDFAAVFWGAIKIGAIAVPVNPLFGRAEIDFVLRDCRARVLVTSGWHLAELRPVLLSQPYLKTVLVVSSEKTFERPERAALSYDELAREASDKLKSAPTLADDGAFLLYTSGSTGQPKGVVHLHRNLIATAMLSGEKVLGIAQDDVVFSAAKLFFAYGLGNGMTFPLHAGASAVLMAERATAESVMRVISARRPTLFFGVPTLYAKLLALAESNRDWHPESLRLCASAGEALPEELGRRWRGRFGVDVLDGIGATETLHNFISNQPGEVRYGATGRVVAGYEVRLLDERGSEVGPGEVGELWCRGPSLAAGYWNNRAATAAAFFGPWFRTRDRFTRDSDGFYRHLGRADDMLKVSGMWVSPAEVEAVLATHPEVQEAAVVGAPDADGLIKPKAFVVVKPDVTPGPELEAALAALAKAKLARYKYPRWISFRNELPRTATGKLQRFKLRS
jgi:benzoate-CoA ligase family protein